MSERGRQRLQSAIRERSEQSDIAASSARNALRASGIARRRTEEKRAEVFFLCARRRRRRRIPSAMRKQCKKRGSSRLVAEAHQRVLDYFGHCGVDPVLAAGDLRRWLLEAHRLDQRLNQ